MTFFYIAINGNKGFSGKLFLSGCLPICHYIAKHSGLTNAITDNDITKLPEPYNKIVKQLSKMCMEALNQQKLIFTIDEIRKACPDISVTPGVTEILMYVLLYCLPSAT